MLAIDSANSDTVPIAHTAMQGAPRHLFSDLPADCVPRTWRNFRDLGRAVNEVYQKLQENDHSGNQSVVLGLSNRNHAIQKLASDGGVFGGIRFWFMFEDSAGVIKVIPSAAHDVTTESLAGMITERSYSMGLRIFADYKWGGSTKHGPTVAVKSKEADHCLWPANRAPTVNRFSGWPTLIFETGVSESLPRLRTDAY